MKKGEISMRSDVMQRITNRAMEIASPFKPNLADYDNGKEFGELYFNGVEFVQVFLYDRHEGVQPNTQINFNMDLEKHDSFLQSIIIYNQQLKKAQEKAIDEVGISEYDKFTYSYYNRVAYDLGYTNVNTFVRSEEKDKKEEESRRKYSEDLEPECSACGDGGCIHCEPHRFIEGKINY
jgi:hypothetical protein